MLRIENMSNKLIRFVKTTDASRILSIYEPYIEKTSITFECKIPSLKDFTQRVEKISSFYPYIVCEVDDEVVGYAYAGKIREREAYQWDAELSIYLDEQYHHMGIGKLLYMALIDLLKLMNIYNIYGVITLPNDASVSLHKDLGFKELGIFQKTGYKFDSWYDVIWLDKSINEFVCPPKPLLSIHDVDEDAINKVISNYCSKLNAI